MSTQLSRLSAEPWRGNAVTDWADVKVHNGSELHVTSISFIANLVFEHEETPLESEKWAKNLVHSIYSYQRQRSIKEAMADKMPSGAYPPRKMVEMMVDMKGPYWDHIAGELKKKGIELGPEFEEARTLSESVQGLPYDEWLKLDIGACMEIHEQAKRKLTDFLVNYRRSKPVYVVDQSLGTRTYTTSTALPPNAGGTATFKLGSNANAIPNVTICDAAGYEPTTFSQWQEAHREWSQRYAKDKEKD